jgi:hypothetical protein
MAGRDGECTWNIQHAAPLVQEGAGYEVQEMLHYANARGVLLLGCKLVLQMTTWITWSSTDCRHNCMMPVIAGQFYGDGRCNPPVYCDSHYMQEGGHVSRPWVTHHAHQYIHIQGPCGGACKGHTMRVGEGKGMNAS